VGKEVLPPPELEKVFGLTGGKYFVLAMPKYSKQTSVSAQKYLIFVEKLKGSIASQKFFEKS
jgi:hypothetical protein